MPSSVLPPARLGFIGLGNMGFPMAGRLAQAGYRLTVADLNAEAVERFCRQHGAQAAPSLEALGAASDVVITMLPEGKAVRGVLTGEPDGVVKGLQPGAILVDMSSSSPVGTRELAAELASRGFTLIDAPVSGGVAKAIDGTLAIMAGGGEETIEACRPLFEQLGKPFCTGGPATGHAMKALNNYLSAATLAVTSEALIAGARFGLDPHTMVEVINASTGRSNSSEHKFPTFILPRRFESGFFLSLMAKDLRFARELATSVNSPHALLDGVSGLYDAAEAALGGKADNTELFRFLEEWGSQA